MFKIQNQRQKSHQQKSQQQKSHQYQPSYSSDLTITKKDEKFLNIAIEQSYKSTMLMRHGCVVVRNGQIIGKGVNHYRNKFDKKFMTNVCCCHAEMDAIHRAMSNITHSGNKTFTVKRKRKPSRFLRKEESYQVK